MNPCPELNTPKMTLSNQAISFLRRSPIADNAAPSNITVAPPSGTDAAVALKVNVSVPGVGGFDVENC